MNAKNQANDLFANIAAMGISNQNKGLVIPQPPVLEEIFLASDKINEQGLFELSEKIDTREELYKEVERQKAYYKPFFENLAPELVDMRIKKELTQFDWRIGTADDMKNFIGVLGGDGSWEKVNVPHYGEPRGVATTYYRTVFEVTEEELQKGSVWMCFKGVDYKAHVFINGMFVGSHEGMFAPFEFEFTKQALVGENTLLVMVENDYICMGSTSEYQGEMFVGDKLYAATGLGYDDPIEGWHHCPPGMGIYQDVFVEARNSLFIKDIFVRPDIEKEKAEVWLEIYSCQVDHRDILVELSAYGQNFKETVFEKMIYKPETYLSVGVGDSLTESRVKEQGLLGSSIPLRLGRGINYLKIPIDIVDTRRWELDSPWLYQLQVKIIDEQGHCTDAAKQQFGMRKFEMLEDSVPKGQFRFNGRQIRLRGANTMGHEQQCVFKKDWEQLLTDLILAKVCNMNFLRLTQRPVQPEIYDYCDKLGLLIQTDLPLFASLRRNQFVEAVRQVEEMEHLIRPHACTIMVSYINEPFPNAQNRPHRCLERPELESFFVAADQVVKLLNPDRVIKHVDGDYDPPSKGLPDNHCYPCWYNGHGIDIGRLNKGYWMEVKEGWYYGCGEFGIEGMDCVDVMRKYYPTEWLPQTPEEESSWSPNRVIGAQTGNFHHFFYDTQTSLENWVEASQTHQALSTTLMTTAYRRDHRMNTFAYHLFIDAFPDGWMKTIMDVERNPKPAFFAYREALTPLMVNIRTDRYKFTAKEPMSVEIWICNDRIEVPEGALLKYYVELDGKVILADQIDASIPVCSSQFQGHLQFIAPDVTERKHMFIHAALVDNTQKVLHDTTQVLEIFEPLLTIDQEVCVIDDAEKRASELANALGLEVRSMDSPNTTIIVSDYDRYKEHEEVLLEKVRLGAKLLVLELDAGNYYIGGKEVEVKNCGMLPLHFVSRATNHPWVQDFKEDDIKYWYDPLVGYITPILERTIHVEGANIVLATGNMNKENQWVKTGAVVEFSVGQGKIGICQVKLNNRTKYNPIAKRFAEKMIIME